MIDWQSLIKFNMGSKQWCCMEFLSLLPCCLLPPPSPSTKVLTISCDAGRRGLIGTLFFLSILNIESFKLEMHCCIIDNQVLQVCNLVHFQIKWNCVGHFAFIWSFVFVDRMEQLIEWWMYDKNFVKNSCCRSC
jgi:hypothetical protein